MKKIISLLLCLALAFGALPLVGCGDRAAVLKVYNVGEYMDEDVIAGFESWYETETGKKITLEYKTYSQNEDMYTEVYKKHADYDVVVGSDYIISRMIRNGLLTEVDREFVYGEDGEAGIIDERIMGFVNDYENYDGKADYTDTVRYSVPYMWGTFGIMYRADLVETELDWRKLSWDELFKAGANDGKRYMKNSVRDAFASAAIVANADRLRELSNGFTDYGEEYYAFLSECINDTSDENRKAVEATLKEQKKYLFAYESDDGKDDMISSSPSAVEGFFWSCDAGYAMEDSTDLYYGVPVEGANVWVDAFTVPKYAGNPEAAKWFLKYLISGTVEEEGDVPYLNRDYAGCSSPITEVQDYNSTVMNEAWDLIKSGAESYDGDDEDVSYYFDFFSEAEGEDFGEMYIDMLFPSEEILKRCAVMRDYDKSACVETAKMWIRVKASV